MQDQTKLPEAFKVRNEPSETISVSARSHREGRVKNGNLPKLCDVKGKVGVGVLSGWGGVA